MAEWGKGIDRELCNRLKFDNIDKRYMHKPESVLENDTHKILCDFKIKTEMKESENIYKYLDLARELKKAVEREVDSNNIYSKKPGKSLQKHRKKPKVTE